MADKEKKSGGRLRLVNFNKEGKGVSKSSMNNKGTLKGFFISFKDNFGKIVSTNILMVLGNFPLFFLIINLSGYFKDTMILPHSDLFHNLGGLFVTSGVVTPYQMNLFALEGMQAIHLVDTTINYIFYAISALTLLTFGIVNVGTAYILRNLAIGEPVFVWHDFKYAIKRNYKQAIPFGILDAIISGILVFNIISLLTNTTEFFLSMMFWSNVVIGIVYFFMRYYFYIQMVTFNLKTFKIIKNSLIFSLLGFKRNILAMLGIVACIFIEFMFLFGLGGIMMPFAIAGPLALLFSAFAYMKVYAGYYKVKEVMIDPYLEAHPEETNNISEEAIMRDDVTEKERLEKIKADSKRK